jgi:hypothetical protein
MRMFFFRDLILRVMAGMKGLSCSDLLCLFALLLIFPCQTSALGCKAVASIRLMRRVCCGVC